MIILHFTLFVVLALVETTPQNTEVPNYPRNYRTYSSDTVDRNAQESQNTPRTYIDNPYLYQNAIPVRQKASQQGGRLGKNQQQPQYRNQLPLSDKEKQELEEEREIEEPDRLSLLLPNSKFSCSERNTGYYADEELGCEVFHYCQDNARHSWICPEGFTFHQVHLICMPPGNDNICDKSSKYHFVNEYLYKPVNLEEYQRKPNVSLRYHERYYPENSYEEEINEEQQEQPQHNHRNSVRVPQGTISRATLRPETNLNQVFRSSNEVNIPLQQRRPPVFVTPNYFNRK